MSEPTHYKQKQEKSGDTIAENKHRKEEKQKSIFSFPLKKISRSEKKKDGVGLPLTSPDMLYKERTPKTNLRGSQSGGYLLSHNIPQCSTIGDAVSLCCLPLCPVPSPLSAPLSPASARSLSRARALSRAPQARTPPPAPRL